MEESSTSGVDHVGLGCLGETLAISRKCWPTWAMLGFSWTVWSHLAPMLGYTWAMLSSPWAIWSYLGPSWALVGLRVGYVRLTWDYGLCWVHLGPLGAIFHLGLSWARWVTFVEPSLSHVGLCVGYVKLMWGHLELSWALVGVRVGCLRSYLGRMLGHARVVSFLAVFGPCWATRGLC